MEVTEIQQRLKDGIAAIKRGEIERGRELLLQVVEADNRIEPAWLWLSAAVDDPADKLVALENALVLNPHNTQAQAQAQRLRQQLGIKESPPPQPAPPPPSPKPAPEPEPAVPLHTAIDPDDDPYQCAYCGKLTDETDNRCPHCGRSLLVPGRWEGRSSRNGLLMLCGMALQAAFLQFLGPVLALAMARGYDPTMALFFSKLPLVKGFFGDFPSWSESVANAHLVATLFRILIWFGLFLMFYTDVEAAQPAAIGVTLADLGWAAIGYRIGYLGLLAAGLNALFDVFILLLSGIAAVSRAQARGRLRVELDRGLYSAPEMYKRGHQYRREGKWALAALHLRKAVVLNPREAQFFKDLGIAQARLGRYQKALSALHEGADRAPGDVEFKRLIESVEKSKDQSTKSKPRTPKSGNRQ